MPVKEIIFKKGASADVRQAKRWYENQQRGLGKRFVEHLELDLRSIAENPNSFKTIRDQIHYKLMTIFPFKIVYEILDAKIFILAVFHENRNPVKLEERLQ